MANFFDFPMDIFLAQIDKIMDEFGFIDAKGKRDDNRFDEEMGWQNNLYRWRRPSAKSVSLITILKISRKFNKSLDWLVWGKEPTNIAAELAAEPYAARPLAPLEADLLHRISGLVEVVLSKQPKPLLPEQKTRLITRIYNDCAEDHSQPDEVMVTRYLWILN